MKVIPAIDIMGGKVVRLTQGLAGQKTVYSDSPLGIAKRWDSYGVELIHVVDLDGAIEGNFKNLGLVRDIASAVRARVELGGGLRDEETIKTVLDSGVKQVVLGTKALDKQFLERCVKNFSDKIVIGIDAKEGIVYTKGWVLKTKVRAVDMARELEEVGISTINYTDISRDGTLLGPNLESLKELLEATRLKVVAGGGISSIADLKGLKYLEAYGLTGVIIGKALYEGTIDLGEAVKMC